MGLNVYQPQDINWQLFSRDKNQFRQRFFFKKTKKFLFLKREFQKKKKSILISCVSQWNTNGKKYSRKKYFACKVPSFLESSEIRWKNERKGGSKEGHGGERKEETQGKSRGETRQGNESQLIASHLLLFCWTHCSQLHWLVPCSLIWGFDFLSSFWIWASSSLEGA